MLTHTNIDRRDSVVVSKAPFTYESTLEINGAVLPAGSFVAVRVYVESGYRMPFRFHSVQPDGKVWLCDSDGQLVCYWQTYEGTEEIASTDSPYVSSLLFKANGVIAGFISCTHTVVSLIRNIVETTFEPLHLPANTFVLIPQCHVSMIEGCGRAFGIGSQDDETVYTTSDIYISGGTNEMIILSGGTNSIQVNMTNDSERILEMAVPNGICNIALKDDDGTKATVDVIGKSIIIKAQPESNLRVVKEDGTIRFIGVLNA